MKLTPMRHRLEPERAPVLTRYATAQGGGVGFGWARGRLGHAAIVAWGRGGGKVEVKVEVKGWQRDAGTSVRKSYMLSSCNLH